VKIKKLRKNGNKLELKTFRILKCS